MQLTAMHLFTLMIMLAATVPGQSRDLIESPRPREKAPRDLPLFPDFVQRLELAEELVTEREGARPFDAGYRRRLVFTLSRLPLEELQEMRRSGQIAPNAIGDTQADLVYTPVQPCRVFDTRSATLGRIEGGQERAFFVTGAGDGAMVLQGGTANGCGIPYGEATAVHINLLLVSPLGESFMTAWPYSTPRPFVSVMNWYSGANLRANAVTVPLCNPAVSSQCTQGDLSIFVSGGGSTHLIGDVLGYYRRFPVEARRSFAWDAQTTTATTIGTSCTNQTGASIAVSVPDVGNMYVEGTAVIQVNHTSGSDDVIEVYVGTSSTDCTTAAARATRHVIPAAVPTASNYQFTIPVSAVFPVNPALSTTATYFLNARNLGSPAGADTFVSSTFVVTFHPD